MKIKKEEKSKNLLKILLSILICLSAGLIGSIFTTPNIKTWYAGLAKPSFTPPNWVFGPVWTILYILMGISLYLIWKKGFKKQENKTALYSFAAQLFVNVLWSAAFFGFHQLLYSFIIIIILWILIVLTIINFEKISTRAAYLLYPYIFWVSFAALLNLSIWLMNR